MSLAVTENLIQASGINSSNNAIAGGADMSPFLKKWLSPTPQFELVSERSNFRSEVEQYVGFKFESSYGAKLAEFLPVFLTLRCADQLSASAGISLGTKSGKFFLEQYMDEPIESELNLLLDEGINRERMVEIGNLVATSRGASRLMFIILASVLNLAGYEWMIFTATKPLLYSLRKLGFETHVIVDAKPARLDKNSTADWGSYYDDQPQVVAGRLSSAQKIVDGRHLSNLVQNFYRSKIDSLAFEINQIGHSNVQA
jgi:hypothetical protein